MTILRKRRLDVEQLSDWDHSGLGTKSIKTGRSTKTRISNVAESSPAQNASTKKQTSLNFIVINSSSSDEGGVSISNVEGKGLHNESDTVNSSVPKPSDGNSRKDTTRTEIVELRGNNTIQKYFRVEIPRRTDPISSTQQLRRSSQAARTAQHVPKDLTLSTHKIMYDSGTSHEESATRARPSRTKQPKKTERSHSRTPTSSMKKSSVPVRTQPKRASLSSTAAQLRYTLSSENESDNSDTYTEPSNAALGTDSDGFSLSDTESTADDTDSSSPESEASSADQLEPRKKDTTKRQKLSVSAQRDASESSNDLAVSDDEQTPAKRAKPPQKLPDSWVYKEGIASNQAPLHEISDIFAHMAGRAVELGFRKVSDHLRGRKLRVATMCSGTESPILSLKEVCGGEFTFPIKLYIT